MAPDPLAETARAFGARNPEPQWSINFSAPYKKTSSYAAVDAPFKTIAFQSKSYIFSWHLDC